MAGIEQTKEVMTFIFSLSEAVEKSLDDGEFSWSDARYFLDPLKKLKPALNEIDEVIPEIMDLDVGHFLIIKLVITIQLLDKILYQLYTYSIPHFYLYK